MSSTKTTPKAQKNSVSKTFSKAVVEDSKQADTATSAKKAKSVSTSAKKKAEATNLFSSRRVWPD